jgi:hypothetical protein
MKQTGKTWIDAEGNTVPVAYVSQFNKLAETYGQRIAAEANAIASRIQSAKAMFLGYGEEMLNRSNAENKKNASQITFYVFDKTYRVEYLKKEQKVTVWKATKENPTYKDYEQIILEMNAAPILFAETPVTTEVVAMKGLGIDLEKMKEDLKDEVDFDSLSEEQQEQLKQIVEKPTKREDPDTIKQAPIGQRVMSGFEKAIKEAAANNIADASDTPAPSAYTGTAPEVAVSNDTGALPIPEMELSETAPDGPSDDADEDEMDRAKTAADNNIAALEAPPIPPLFAGQSSK